MVVLDSELSGAGARRGVGNGAYYRDLAAPARNRRGVDSRGTPPATASPLYPGGIAAPD
jgi:hypothetical protein